MNQHLDTKAKGADGVHISTINKAALLQIISSGV